MLAEAGLGAIPAQTDVRGLLLQQRDVRGRAPERVGAKIGGHLIRPPKEHTNVDATLARTCQHLKERPAAIGHLKGGPKKGDTDPHPRVRVVDSLTDPAKGRLAINVWGDAIISPNRIGTGGDKRNMSYERSESAHDARKPLVGAHR